MQLERLQVVGGEHGFDTGQLERRVFVDRFDPGVTVRRPDEITEQHPRQLEIIDVVALALREANVLDALAPGPKTLEFLGARLSGFEFGAHSAASLALVRRSAAARIALTMF